MYKILKFIVQNFLRIFIGIFLNLIIRKDKKILLLAHKLPKTKYINKERDFFLHNTKYLFLKYNNLKCQDLKLIYLCDDNDMLQKFIQKGYTNVYSKKSLKGFYYMLKAKYWAYDHFKNSISTFFSFGVIGINLWHGIALKKIGYDEPRYNKLNFIQKIFIHLANLNYIIINSDYENAVFKSSYFAKDYQFRTLGSPRLDVLYNDIPNADLFMEKDFNAIKTFKEQGRKIFIYLPTFRDTGKNISGWLRSEKVKLFLQKNNIILVCKLHPFDKNSLNFKLTENFYKMDNNSDVYPILKYTDCLISDYSSVYFDYLLLDKPILYYIPDLKEYQEKCRGFYGSYEELTAGLKSKNEIELLSDMQDVINGVDNYKEKRKMLRDKMFVYQDGKNCERVVDWIKSLNK